jgi:hypothetical protein
MTAEKFIMWGCAVLLGFVLWGVGAKLDAMQDEHQKLLSINQVVCYNQAELIHEQALRSKQQKRCLDYKLALDELK